jgi:hypothetical protein
MAARSQPRLNEAAVTGSPLLNVVPDFSLNVQTEQSSFDS